MSNKLLAASRTNGGLVPPWTLAANNLNPIFLLNYWLLQTNQTSHRVMVSFGWNPNFSYLTRSQELISLMILNCRILSNYLLCPVDWRLYKIMEMFSFYPVSVVKSSEWVSKLVISVATSWKSSNFLTRFLKVAIGPEALPTLSLVMTLETLVGSGQVPLPVLEQMTTWLFWLAQFYQLNQYRLKLALWVICKSFSISRVLADQTI